MRLQLIILTTFLIGCSTTDKNQGLFDDLADKETVVIYLSKYNLDSVPSEIGKLKKVKSLFITKDSTSGWTIYPPLSALQRMTEVPPFRQLPNEITELTTLQNLVLAGLDLNTLPDNFDRLQELDSLNLFLNKLTISVEIEKLNKLKNLRYLGLYGNKIDTADLRELKRENPNLVIDSGIE
jgi:hypothetical protein